jgi:dihydrofolate synthase / folylpolyglutamate synthase
MNIGEALDYVEGHIHYGTWAARSSRSEPVHLSLARMRRFVHVLGDPQRATPVIHVNGTNGKGSTAEMITRLLMAEGLRVGTYSSPHIARYQERFRINDSDIDDDTLASLLTSIQATEKELGEQLMPFEILTGAALVWFAGEQLDAAVIEVGVLGRFDATNVADGKVAVMTNIGFDHTNGEGDWEMRIAEEKAGIVKPGCHLILGELDPRLETPFREQRPEETWRLGREIVIDSDEPAGDGRLVSISTPWQSLTDVDIPLYGAHQTRNGALAISAASAFLERPLDPAHAAAGLASVQMPARLELVSSEPQVILDGAHNPDAARALAQALHDDLPSEGHRTLIIGLLSGRDPATMLEALDADRFDTIIACTPPTTRARPASEVAEAAMRYDAEVREIERVDDALNAAIQRAAPDDQIVVTGSIYLVAQARESVSTAGQS